MCYSCRKTRLTLDTDTTGCKIQTRAKRELSWTFGKKEPFLCGLREFVNDVSLSATRTSWAKVLKSQKSRARKSNIRLALLLTSAKSFKLDRKIHRVEDHQMDWKNIHNPKCQIIWGATAKWAPHTKTKESPCLMVFWLIGLPDKTLSYDAIFYVPPPFRSLRAFE